jgi:hypothetical protein
MYNCSFIYSSPTVGGHNHEVLQPCRVLQGQKPLCHWGDRLHGEGIKRKVKNILQRLHSFHPLTYESTQAQNCESGRKLCCQSELLMMSCAAGYGREIAALVPWRRVNLFVDEVQKRSAAEGSTRGTPDQPGLFKSLVFIKFYFIFIKNVNCRFLTSCDLRRQTRSIS